VKTSKLTNYLLIEHEDGSSRLLESLDPGPQLLSVTFQKTRIFTFTTDRTLFLIKSEFMLTASS
jgi:hypothetical protein